MTNLKDHPTAESSQDYFFKLLDEELNKPLGRGYGEEEREIIANFIDSLFTENREPYIRIFPETTKFNLLEALASDRVNYFTEPARFKTPEGREAIKYLYKQTRDRENLELAPDTLAVFLNSLYSGILAEIPHLEQYNSMLGYDKDEGITNDFLDKRTDVIKKSFSQRHRDPLGFRYHTPGHIEHSAHYELEPLLYKALEELTGKEMRPASNINYDEPIPKIMQGLRGIY